MCNAFIYIICISDDCPDPEVGQCGDEFDMHRSFKRGCRKLSILRFVTSCRCRFERQYVLTERLSTNKCMCVAIATCLAQFCQAVTACRYAAGGVCMPAGSLLIVIQAEKTCNNQHRDLIRLIDKGRTTNDTQCISMLHTS
jgi:hypothetical protein